MSMMPQQCIEEIRNQYVDLKDMPRESLNASVKALADDLYAKDSHFVFELIQNAEDNHYDSGVSPSLRLALQRVNLNDTRTIALVVENNEIGFEQRHVEALCQVGKTTKTKAQGYIGEKGIGFKSVFRITDCPRVFSKGFQFALPKHDPEVGLGYIVPQWVDHPPHWVTPQCTTIVLPLDGSNPRQVQSVAKSLRDIAPETILFLNKLQVIEIACPKRTTLIQKNNSGPLVEVKRLVRRGTGEQCVASRYWKHSRSFDVPPEAAHEKRRDIVRCAVSVAIPLDAEATNGKLFAYLPVWDSTGLPFLINADFLLVSSREGVHVELPWNQWLRDRVAEVYIEAFLSGIKELEVPLRYAVYASIPMKANERFLEPVVGAIHEALENAECVATAPSGELRKPADVLYAVPDELRRLFLCHPSLPSHLDKVTRPVMAELEQYSDRLRAIGATRWSHTDATECLKDAEWLGGRPLPWFVELYQALRKITQLPSLATLPIVPIQSEPFVLSCDSDQPVYFPRDKEAEEAMAQLPKWLQRLVPVAFIAPEFMSLVDAADQTLREWMLNTLKVDDFTLNNYCVRLSKVLADKHAKMSAAHVMQATRFILKHLDDTNDTEIPVVLSDGTVVPLGQARHNERDVVVPAKHNPTTGWQHIWKTDRDREHFVALSDKYCEILSKEEQSILFSEFRIVQYPGFRKFTKKYGDILRSRDIRGLSSREFQLLEECRNKAAAAHKDDTTLSGFTWPSDLTTVTHEASAAIEKWLMSHCPHLNTDIRNSSQLHKYGLKSRCTYEHYGPHHEYVDSIVLERLRTLPWLRSTKGLVRPDEAFVAARAVTEVLGDHVAYYEGDLPNNVLELLGVHAEITVEVLLGILKRETQKDTANSELASKIYAQLNARWPEYQQQIMESFTNDRLILVKSRPGDKDSPKAVWRRPDEIDQASFAELREHYPEELESFFRRLTTDEQRLSQREMAVRSAAAGGASVEAVQRFLSLSADEQKRIMADQPPTAFPSHRVRDVKRRLAKKTEQHDGQPDKEYEHRERSVRTSKNTPDAKEYLQSMYTNDDDEVVCQLCQKSLDHASFAKLNGQPYFEAVEFFGGSEKEDEANNVLLCPLCAAKFKELVKARYSKPDSLEPQMRTPLLKLVLGEADESDLVIQITMNDKAEVLRFVEKHWNDLQVVARKAKPPVA